MSSPDIDNDLNALDDIENISVDFDPLEESIDTTDDELEVSLPDFLTASDLSEVIEDFWYILNRATPSMLRKAKT